MTGSRWSKSWTCTECGNPGEKGGVSGPWGGGGPGWKRCYSEDETWHKRLLEIEALVRKKEGEIERVEVPLYSLVDRYKEINTLKEELAQIRHDHCK